jgi:phosphohistidine phosphatase
VFLYLIRHAHAVDPTEDPERPLSKRGREQVRALAALLGQSTAFQPTEIWHSPLLRSRETAERLAQHMKLEAPLSLMPGLEPEDDPTRIVRRIKPTLERLAVVGHEPYLSALATLLVRGAPSPPAFVMKKCAALALEGEGNFWMVRWHVSPELFA